MDADERDDLFGRIALEKEFLSEEELQDALDARKHLRDLGMLDKSLADIMVQKGYIIEMERQEVASQLEEGQSWGTTVHGYQVLLEIKHEAPGRLYKAYQPSMDRTVLIRILSKTDHEEAELIKSLKREAKLFARLQHPGIVSGLDAGETDKEYFLVLEYVEGIKLSQLLEVEGALEESAALKIAARLARALEYLDEAGIVHRDIEPENILVGRSGEVKIASLALSVWTEELAGCADTNTQTATPFYLAPEQAKGFTDLDIRSDLFSLGATLFHMLTGQLPFGSDPVMAPAHIIAQETPDPRTLNPDIPEAVSALVARLMQKEKQDRYYSPRGVWQEIEGILSSEPPAPAPAPAPARPRRGGRSKRQRVKQALRALQAQSAAAGASPATAPPTQAILRQTPPAAQAAHPKAEPVKARSSAVKAAKLRESSSSAIFAVIGIIVAVIIIMVAVTSIPRSREKVDHRDSPARKPKDSIEDILPEEDLPEEVKELRKLKRMQNEDPGSPEVIARLNEFLGKVKDPEVKKAALLARNSAITVFYESASEEAEEQRKQHYYSQAIQLYQELLGFIPESMDTVTEGIKIRIQQTELEADDYFSREAARAEDLLKSDKIEEALQVYKKLQKGALESHAEVALAAIGSIEKLLAERKSAPAAGDKPGEGPDERTPEEIEAELEKDEQRKKLFAERLKILSELQSEVASHIRYLRLQQAQRYIKAAIAKKEKPKYVEAGKEVKSHLDMIESVVRALGAGMKALRAKDMVQLTLKKRGEIILGKLVRYDTGVIIFQKTDGLVTDLHILDLHEKEIERCILEGFRDKSAENMLAMAVFFVYFYGDSELVHKYLGQAKAAGAKVQEYLAPLQSASFSCAFSRVNDFLRRKDFLSAYMKLSEIRSNFSKSIVYKGHQEQIEILIKDTYHQSGLAGLFAGSLTCHPPIFETSYDFSHSSQLADFSERTWATRAAEVENPNWTLQAGCLEGKGDTVVVWKGKAEGELSVTFFVEPVEAGPFEVLLFAHPAKPFQSRAYAFGFSTLIDRGVKGAAPEHYIAVWNGRKSEHKYLKRGIMKPKLEEGRTYLVQILVRQRTLQLFINEKLLGEVNDSQLNSGTVILRTHGTRVRFDNLIIKARLNSTWLKKASKEAKGG